MKMTLAEEIVELIKLFGKTIFLLAILITAFYLTTFIQTWWGGDLEVKYCPPDISEEWDKKIRAAVLYHGPMNKYRCDWEKGEFTFERDGQTIDMFAYLEKEK
jgi:hypothetical protein